MGTGIFHSLWRRERAERAWLQAELHEHYQKTADVLLRERRIAEATREGEREAAAMFVESHGKDTLATMIREGGHLTRLMKSLN